MKISNKIKIPKNLSNNEIINYFKKWKILNYFKSYRFEKNTKELNTLVFSSSPYSPELKDLYRLHSFLILNKRLTVLEFGSGWSSLVMAHALKINKLKHSLKTKALRKSNKFEIHSIENEKKYLNISKRRLYKFLGAKNKSFFHFSNCKMTVYNGKICSEYNKLPLVNPDFIYLDGPDQKKILGNIKGITINHSDMLPILCDILKIEYFLIPGTIIVTDGRTANALFLKNNFQRNWIYYFDRKNDQNLFYLNDDSLGPVNEFQRKFYKKV
tara:strand:+ start:455 stop:1264 length:810 start_codon:yes stop_codon:yes gene_type:complete